MIHTCRTCLEDIPDANYVSLAKVSESEELKTQLALCVPELTIGLHVFADAVMCAPCIRSLHSAYVFKKQCLKSEEYIQKYLQKRHIGITLTDVMQDAEYNLRVGDLETNDLGNIDKDNICIKEEFSTLEKTEFEPNLKEEHENNLQQEAASNCTQQELHDLLQLKWKQVPCNDIAKRYKCEKCSFSAKDRSSLLKHKTIHSNERPFRCTICSYRSKRKDSLTVHLKRHRTEKPYNCPQCNYNTVTKQYLRRHIMMSHLEMRPYKCKECHLSFVDKGTLTKHMLTHTNIKPFKCKICQFSTKRKYSLATHMKSHA